MNRAERRRQQKGTPTSRPGDGEPKPQYTWKKFFDAKPMADGMPPSFLLYLLNERDVFERHGKLLTAALWLQSQLVSLICLSDDSELQRLTTLEHGRYFPYALARAALVKLEDLSSERLREEFLQRFGDKMSQDLQADLARVTLSRDALAHGYLSLFRQLDGQDNIAWSPRQSIKREAEMDRVLGPRPENTYFALRLSDQAFEEEIERICRLMDFVASQVKQWDIPYAVFA